METYEQRIVIYCFRTQSIRRKSSLSLSLICCRLPSSLLIILPFIFYSHSFSSPFQSPRPPPLLLFFPSSLLPLSHFVFFLFLSDRAMRLLVGFWAARLWFNPGVVHAGTEVQRVQHLCFPANVPHPSVIRDWHSYGQSHPTPAARQGRISW
jgi:hypothetical protein